MPTAYVYKNDQAKIWTHHTNWAHYYNENYWYRLPFYVLEIWSVCSQWSDITQGITQGIKSLVHPLYEKEDMHG